MFLEPLALLWAIMPRGNERPTPYHPEPAHGVVGYDARRQEWDREAREPIKE